MKILRIAMIILSVIGIVVFAVPSPSYPHCADVLMGALCGLIIGANLIFLEPPERAALEDQ